MKTLIACFISTLAFSTTAQAVTGRVYFVNAKQGVGAVLADSFPRTCGDQLVSNGEWLRRDLNIPSLMFPSADGPFFFRLDDVQGKIVENVETCLEYDVVIENRRPSAVNVRVIDCK